nr:MAG TPA: hypothetical protein [Caudoviricetes sp.]
MRYYCYRSIMSATSLRNGFPPAFRLVRVEPV